MRSQKTPFIDESKPVTPSDIATTMEHFRKLTLTMATEINRAILDCMRAGRQMIESIGTVGPTRH